jgi:hypothetical protein
LCQRLDSTGKQRHRFIPGPVWSSTRNFHGRGSSKDLAKGKGGPAICIPTVSANAVNRNPRFARLLKWPLSQVAPSPRGQLSQIIQLFALDPPSTHCSLHSKSRGWQLWVVPCPFPLVAQSPFPLVAQTIRLSTDPLLRVCQPRKCCVRRHPSQMPLTWYDQLSVALTRRVLTLSGSRHPPTAHKSNGAALASLANAPRR